MLLNFCHKKSSKFAQNLTTKILERFSNLWQQLPLFCQLNAKLALVHFSSEGCLKFSKIAKFLSNSSSDFKANFKFRGKSRINPDRVAIILCCVFGTRLKNVTLPEFEVCPGQLRVPRGWEEVRSYSEDPRHRRPHSQRTTSSHCKRSQQSPVNILDFQGPVLMPGT